MAQEQATDATKYSVWAWRCDDKQVVVQVQEIMSGISTTAGRRRPDANKDHVTYIKQGVITHKTKPCSWRALWEFIKRFFVDALADIPYVRTTRE